MTRPDTDDYTSLFLNDVPLMDVRAPVEFLHGSFPNTVNAPLMDDEERHRVGTRYKEQGQDAAIELGHQLVRDDIKAARVEQWKRFAIEHPEGYLFCFRGGLRSRTVQRWMAEAGVDYPLVKGGYKALRRFLIDQLERDSQEADLVLLSGRTGTGKTRVLKKLPNHVDMEGIANHRGSSFGRMTSPQPTQIDFENALAVDLMKARRRAGPVVVEDEGRLIGRCALPDTLRGAMARAPLAVLERSLSERVTIIREDYVEEMLRSYQYRDGELAGWENFRDYLTQALDRIRKRLGGQRHEHLRNLMIQALELQKVDGNTDAHNLWIEALLKDYYDPMYDYQLSQRQGLVVVRGSETSIAEWAKSVSSK